MFLADALVPGAIALAVENPPGCRITLEEDAVVLELAAVADGSLSEAAPRVLCHGVILLLRRLRSNLHGRRPSL